MKVFRGGAALPRNVPRNEGSGLGNVEDGGQTKKETHKMVLTMGGCVFRLSDEESDRSRSFMVV